MAVHLDAHLKGFVVFLFYINHVVQPILANNIVNVDADSGRVVNGTKVKYGSGYIPDYFRSKVNEAISPSPAQQTFPEAINRARCGLRNGGRYQQRIVGGQAADPGEWPWMAVFFIPGAYCGGTLIDNQHILTAAHCTNKITIGQMRTLKIHLGDYNLETDREVRHVVKRVKWIVQHPNYAETPYMHNDIAILTIDTPVRFTQWIRPICLPYGWQSYVGHTATAIGWGHLMTGGPGSAILQEASMPILTNAECATRYHRPNFLPSILCAGRYGVDTCQGDSGGPLMVYGGGRWTLVGVISWGYGCADPRYYGVYARVTHFMPWLRRNLR